MIPMDAILNPFSPGSRLEADNPYMGVLVPRLFTTDQMGAQYDLPLAAGDRVRLFARTNAAYADKSRGIIGNNGSVLEVRRRDSRRSFISC